jgi:hypothetical protein
MMTPEERDRYKAIDRSLEFLASNRAQLPAELHKLKVTTGILKEIIGMHTSQTEEQEKHIAELGNCVLRLGHIAEEQKARTPISF